MKKTFLAFGLLVSLSTFAQEKKKDSLVLQITIDTTTFKNVIKLIDENIDSRTLTGKMIKENIIAPLMNYQLVADKPKTEIKPIKK
jgi:hypothetical protein